MRALVTGGASCGKSQVAEDLCQTLGGDLAYLAAMPPFGAESQARIARHRQQRDGKGFRTIECHEGLAVALVDSRIAGATALLEDLGNVVANRLFGSPAAALPLDEARIVAEIARDLDALASRCAHLVVVGNEVGCDGVHYGEETQGYQRVLGMVAQTWAATCDYIVECSAGMPRVLRDRQEGPTHGKDEGRSDEHTP